MTRNEHAINHSENNVVINDDLWTLSRVDRVYIYIYNLGNYRSSIFLLPQRVQRVYLNVLSSREKKGTRFSSGLAKNPRFLL